MFNDSLSILSTLRPLWMHQRAKLLLLFLITLILGLSSSFSIVLLIPLLQIITNENGEQEHQIGQYFSDLANNFGIQLTLESILIIYVILLCIMAVLQYLKVIMDASFQQSFIYKIRSRLFRKIIMADWRFLNTKSKTNHLQVFSKEVPKLTNYYYFLLRLLTGLIMIASYLSWALLLSVKFTLIITLTGIILFYLLRKFIVKAFHFGKGYVNAYNHLLKSIDDFWLTVKIAKVHSSEEFYYEKFSKASSKIFEMEYRLERNYSLPQLIYRISGVLVLVLLIYLGYRFDQLPLTSFFVLIILFSRIYPRFTAMISDVNMIVSNLSSVKLVMQMDSEFPKSTHHFIKEKIEFKKEIFFNNISFGYEQGEELFKKFNAKIFAFKLTGIIGESGRGKTTLIDLIAGLQKPKSGNIKVDEEILTEEKLTHWRLGIGYLPQDSFFIDGTLRENLVWDSPVEVTDEDIIKVLKQFNASHLVERLPKGLDEEIVNFVFHFSGGERQRLALTRVLLRKPRILLLDEATSSLDSENEALIMDLLSKLKKKVTIVFVTHRKSVLPWFDQVIEV